MADNPYSAAISRYFCIAFYTTGAMLFTYILISCISSGRISGFSRYSRIIGESYTSAANPSQFWFMIMFYAAGAVLFTFLAWRSYQGART
jgi:hypothetical protein